MNVEMNKKISDLISGIIKRNIGQEEYTWLLDKATESAGNENNYQLNLTFTSIPRKTGKKEIIINEQELAQLHELLPGFSIQHWTIDRLCRVWLLMQLDTGNKELYLERIQKLFPQAEMNEQVALYSSLPLLAYAEDWKPQCAIGIRSNIGTVLEAIMYHNPYPAKWLDESAWNQLIMKAFFTEKNVNKIPGVDKRNNRQLANMLFDYIEERSSAHRTVNPQIWRFAGKYIDEPHFYLLEKLFSDVDETNQQAAALACSASSFEKAKLLLGQHPEYKNSIDRGELTWNVLANKNDF